MNQKKIQQMNILSLFLIFCFLINTVIYPGSFGFQISQKDKINDDLDDVFYWKDSTAELPPIHCNTTPCIDIDSVSYELFSNGTVTVSLRVNNNSIITNRNDFEDIDNNNYSDFPYTIIIYKIEIITSNNIYLIEYINYQCEINNENHFHFTVNGSKLNVSFQLISKNETIQSTSALTYKYIFHSMYTVEYYADFAPNDELFTAQITASSTTAGRGEPIHFSVNITDKLGITIPPYRYTWDFGNNCQKTGKIVNYTYLSSRDYRVVVTINDSFNTTTSDEKMITITDEDCIDPILSISKPKHGFYLLNLRFGRNIFKKPYILGRITVSADPYDRLSGIEYVDFYLDDEKQFHDETIPYEWIWKKRCLFPKEFTIKVITGDFYDNTAEKSITVYRLF